MKTFRSCMMIIGLACAFKAEAGPHTFTGTINSPDILVWVNTNGDVVSSYLAGSAYVDPSTGFIWGINGPTTSSPQATYVDVLRQYYATSNCTGTIYVAIPSSSFGGSSGVTIYLYGSIYAAVGSPVSPTILQSEWNGSSCVAPYAVPAGFTVYSASGPLTPPVLPAGPYHLEVR